MSTNLTYLLQKVLKTHHLWWVQDGAALSSLLRMPYGLVWCNQKQVISSLPPAIIIMIRTMATITFIVEFSIMPSIIMATTAENAVRRLVLSLL